MRKILLLLLLVLLSTTATAFVNFTDQLADEQPRVEEPITTAPLQLGVVLSAGLKDKQEEIPSADVALNGEFASRLVDKTARQDADLALNGQFAAKLIDDEESQEIKAPEPVIFKNLDKKFDDPAEVSFRNKQGRKGKANWTVRADKRVDAVLELDEVRAEIRGIPEKIVEAVTDTVLDRTITTPIFAADDIAVETAEITLPKYGPVTAIMKCDKFDVENVTCNGSWNPSWLPFVDNGTHVIFNATGFSGYGGANITILNVQSYPTVGGNWEVHFNTAGTADLLITAINQTTWSDNDELHDLKFLSVGCDGATYAYEWVNDSVFIEDYSCNATGTETSKVITTGKHHLAFTFGNMTVYAHNFASGIGTLAQIYDTVFGQDGDTSVIAMSMPNETILDSPFNHTENANLTFNEDGLYKVSYGVTWTSTGANGRHIMRNFIRKNANEDVVPSETRCYIRNTNADGQTCSNAGVLIVNASAGDFISLMGTKDKGTAGATITSSDVWLYAQQINRKVAQTYDPDGGEDMNNVNLIISTDTATYVDTDVFTQVGNATQVSESGFYKIYYSVSHELSDVNTDSDRRSIQVHLLQNGTTNVTPSATYSYVREEGTGDQNHNTGAVLLNLASGATIELVAIVEEENEDRQHTTLANMSWMFLERIDSVDVLQVRESIAGQTVAENAFDAISFDTNDFIGQSFHRPDEFNITFNESGWYEVSYSAAWDDGETGGRHIVSTVMRLNGQTIIQPSNQSDYTRGDASSTLGNGRYNSNAGTFIINVSAGDSLELFMAPIGGSADTEPNATWINIISAQAIEPTLNTSILTPALGIVNRVVQNNTFDFNVTVTCEGISGDCGEVFVTTRYNASGADPDTNISSLLNATPFVIVDSVRDNEIIVALFSTSVELRKWEFIDGAWTESNIINTEDQIEAIDIDDADNDGDNEIVIEVDTQNQVRILDFNPTDGTWSIENVSGNLDWHIEDLEIGDADNDGLNEIVIAMERTSTGEPTSGVTPVRMYKLVGGTWTETNITGPGESNSVQDVDIGDADHDGQNEIVALFANVTGDSGHNSALRLYENSTSPWTEVIIKPLTGGVDARAERMMIGDVDNDGDEEVVAGFWDDDTGTPVGRMSFFENDTGSWAEFNISDSITILDGLDIDDVNHDGRLDIAAVADITASGGGENQVRLFQNLSGGFTELNVSDVLSDLGRDADIGDANNDRQNDIVAAQGNPLFIYENVTGAQTNTTINTFSVDIDSAQIADADNDGRLNNISCGILLVGESCQINYTILVTGPVRTQWALDLNVSSDSDEVGNNDSENAIVRIVGVEFANISVGKLDLPDPVNTSSNLSYVINLTSTGSDTAFNVTVNETYPPQVIFLEGSPTPQAGTNNSFFIGDMVAGEIVQVNITVLVTNVSNNTILNNSVNVTFQNESADLLSNSVTESTTVELLLESVNISVNMTNTTAPTGLNATYLITIGNNGTHQNTYNITVQNLDGVGTAEINQSEITLNPGTSGVILHTVRSIPPGAFNTTISVVDFGNSEVNATTTRLETTFVDAIAPNVTTLSPSGAIFNTTGITVNITARIVDDIQVDVVQANVTLPNLTTRIISLTDPDSDDFYNGTLTETNLFGRYDFRIIANDTSSNLNDSETAFFFIAQPMRLDVDADEDQYGQGSTAVITINATNTTGVTVANVTTVTDIIYGNGSIPFNAPWFDPGLARRIPLNITEQSGNNLLGYVLNFTIDTAAMITDGELQGDCDDIRFAQFLDNTTTELNYSIMKHTCNTSSTLFFVGVPSVPSSGIRQVYLYHDNDSIFAGSNNSVFRISRNVTAYALSNVLSSNQLSIASYVDGNEISVDGTLIGIVNRSQILQITTAQYNNESVITGTGPFDGVFNDTGDTNGDNLAPQAFAGTRFAMRQDRGLAALPIIAPFGDAEVQVFNGTTLAVTANLQQGQMSVLTPGSAAGNGIIIESNESVIVRWESTTAQDFHMIYPAFTDLWGVPTGQFEIAALENDTNVSVLTSAGVNFTVNLSRGESFETSGGGSEGTAPAARIISNRPVGVYQEADGDGTESTVFIPEFELSTEYFLPVPATYIALATTEPGTNCTLTETNGSITNATSTAQARPFPNKILFGGAGDDDLHFRTGARIVCDALFYAMFEFQNDDSQTGTETNLFGPPSSRQLVQPVPIVSQNSQSQFVQRDHGITDENGIATFNFDTTGQPFGNYTVVSTGNKTDRFTASGSDEFEVVPAVDTNQSNVSVTKTDNPDPVNVSANLSYQINVSSTGDDTAFNVTVNDTYPEQVIFLAASPSPLAGTNNTFILGNMTSGTTISINITVFTTNVSTNTLLNNSVNVTFNNATGDLLSRNVTESTTVLSPPAIVGLILDSPFENVTTNITQNNTFIFRVNVSCTDGAAVNCGNVSVFARHNVSRGISRVISDQFQLNNSEADIAIGEEVENGTSILYVSVRQNVDAPSDGHVTGRILNSTHLRFTGPLGNIPMFIQWYVAEFEPDGLRVFRDRTAITGNLVEDIVPIGAEIDFNASFIVPGGHNVSGTLWGADDYIRMRLVNSTHLGYITGSTTTAESIVWQVVDFVGANVQRDQAEMLGSQTRMLINFTEVDLNRSYITLTYFIDATTNSADGNLLSRFVNSTQFEINRGNTGVTANISWQVVELPLNTTVQHDVTSFGANDLELNVTINPVAVDQSVAFASSGPHVGTSTGNTSFIDNDIPGYGLFTLTLTNSTNLQLRRNVSGNVSSLGWFVVDYGTDTSKVFVAVNTTAGSTPFFTADPQPQNCILDVDESCQVNWTINATGDINTIHNLHANASSNETDVNTTVSSNTTIVIEPFVILFNLSNVSVTKTDSPDPVSTSSNLSYQINVSSNGNGTAFNVTVNDTYPEQVIFLDASPSPLSGTNNTFILGNMTAGTTVSVNITVFTTNVSNNTLINNSVNVTFNNETGAELSQITTESTTVETPVQINQSNLSVTKTDSPDPVTTSTNLSYQINVTSNGNGTAFNVTVNDTYPPQVIFLDSSPSPLSGTNNTFILGNLTAGAFRTINITVLVTNVSNNTVLNNSVNVTFNNETGALPSVVATESTTAIVPVNVVPIVENVTLNATSVNNLSSDNLTLFFDSFDTNNDPVTNITNFFVDNVSFTELLLAFEAHSGNENVTVKDYSGFGRNGSVVNAVFNASGGIDGFGSMEFNGINMSIDNITNQTINTQEGTIMLWARPNVFELDLQQHLVWAGDSAGNGYGPNQELHLSIRHFNTSHNLTGFVFWYGDNDADSSMAQLRASDNWTFVGSGNLTDDRWYHVAVTWDLNVGITRLYLNGSLFTSDNNTGETYDTDAWQDNIHIGRPGAATRFYNGTIDDLRIYDRALSPEQIMVTFLNHTRIVSNETAVNETWFACTTPNDGFVDGNETCSNNVTIIADAKPTIVFDRFVAVINETTNTTVLNESTLRLIDTFHVLYNVTDDNGVENIRLFFKNTNGSINDTCQGTINSSTGNIGNLQHEACFDFLEYDNTTDTSTVRQSFFTGDGIIFDDLGNTQFRWIVEDIYKPLFKNYPFNDTTVRFEREFNLTRNNSLRLRLDNDLIPADATIYEVNMRFNFTENITAPLFGYLCNSSFPDGNTVISSSNCKFLGSQNASDFREDSLAVFIVFSNETIDDLGGSTRNLSLVFTSEDSLDPGIIFLPQVANVSNASTQNISFFSTDLGVTETPMFPSSITAQLHWLYDGTTCFSFFASANDTIDQKVNSTLEQFCWEDFGANFPPSAPRILTPGANQTISGLFNITWLDGVDPDGNDFNISIFLFNQDGTLNLTIAANNITEGTEIFEWNTLQAEDGVYRLNITANDTFGAESSELTSYNFTIDNTPPAVVNITPAAGTNISQNDLVNISADIVDALANVSVAIAEVTLPNGTRRNFTLDKITPSTYVVEFNETATLGQYNVTFFANDTLPNLNETETTFFISQDGIVPAVFDGRPVQTTIFLLNETISVSAIATDNVNVSSVSINLTYPNGTTATFNLSNNEYAADTDTVLLLHLNEESGTPSDSSGHDHSVTLENSEVVGNLSGKFGKGMNFTNTGRLNITDDPLLDFGANENFTVELWANLTSPGEPRVLVSKLHSSDTTIPGYEIFIDSTDEPVCRIRNGTHTFDNRLVNVTNLIDNQFHHFACTRDASTQECAFYIDGELQNTTFCPASDLSNDLNVMVGNSIDRGLPALGILDDVRISNVTRTGLSPDYYNSTFADLIQRGRYNITFIANDTLNNVNFSTTTFFFRQGFDIFDLRMQSLDENDTSTRIFANYTVTTLSNVSGILNLSINLSGSRMKEINITNHNENSPRSILDIDDWQPGRTSSATYAVNPEGFNFTGMLTVTVNASGQQFRKCANWSFATRDCLGGFGAPTTITPGQLYTFTVNSTDPGFSEGSPAVDVALAPVDNESFVLAFIRNDTDVLEFRYLDTDGTLIANTTVDSSVDTDSRVSVAPINATHVALSWVDGPSDIIRRQIFNVTGTNATGVLDVVSSVGLFTDVSVSQIGDRFGICNANDGNGDAEFRAYNNTDATELVSTVQVDSNMRPEATLQNLVECAGVNSTRSVFAWFDDQGPNTMVYSILDENGNIIVDRQIVDTTPGDPAQVATSAIDNDKFVVLWYDQQEQDVTFTVRNIDNTELLAPTDIDVLAGTESRVAITAVRNESASQDFFVTVWFNQSESAIKAAVFNGTGSIITQPFTVDNTPNTAFRLLDVTAKEPMSNNSVCPGHFVVAFSNDTDQGVFRTYNINGSEWDGVCAVGQPDLRLNATSIFFNNTFPAENENVSVNVTICNIGDAAATAFNVTFKDGNETGGVEISNETISSLPAGECAVANDTYVSVIGNRTICAVADAPLPTGVVSESNESNNVGCTQLHVQQYSFFFGQIDSNLTLGDANNLEFAWNHTDGGKLYFYDADSAFNFSALQALGRNTTNGTAENDFEEATISLNMTVFNESVTLLWAVDNSTPRRVVNITVDGRLIEGVPIINSTNTSFFVTGILWDTQDDDDGQFDIADSEDLVFVVNISQDRAGGLGAPIDYEARIPSLLREYKGSADVISFRTELT